MELALRTTLILAVAWAIARVLPRAAAATRHLVWHLAVVGVLAAPAIAPLAPRFMVPTIPGLAASTALLAMVADTERTAALPFSGVPDTRISSTDTSDTPGAASTSGTRRTRGTRGTFATLASLAWVTGSVGLTLWFALGWLVTALAVRRAHRAPAAWQVEVNAWRERLHIAREVTVCISAGETSPMVTGLWRTVILMPESAREWDADRRRSVLLHELAHVRRGDLRVQVLAQVATAAYWFNPLVWIASTRLRSERERASDDEVLRTGAQPSTYASHLLDVARELRPTLRPSAALAMARASDLEGRLLAVLATDRARAPARATRWAIAVTFAIATTVALGATPSTMTMTQDTTSPLVRRPKTSRFSVFAQDEQPPAERLAAERAMRHASDALASSTDAQTRERAVMELAASGQPDTIRPLETALADADQDVREKAALALGLISSPDVIPGLLKAMADPDAQVREKAAIGLALRRDSRVADALIAAMDDSDAQVREKAAIALATSGDPRASGALERALQDPDSQVREKAATGLLLARSAAVDPTRGDQARESLRRLIGGLLMLAR